MNFDEYIEKNYSELLLIAGRIFFQTELQSEEIIHELYIDIVTNKREINPTEKDFEYYCRRWIKSRLKWKGGNVIKELRISDKKTDNIEKYKFRLSIQPQEIKTETALDLERIGFSEEQSEKLSFCVLLSKSLPLYDKRLFELYYREGYSIGQIAQSCNLPKTSIARDIKKLNKKLIPIQ
jgi:RNA polymerase sigma factor (sigma-70 family)